jgi:hypothetical protein
MCEVEASCGWAWNDEYVACSWFSFFTHSHTSLTRLLLITITPL